MPPDRLAPSVGEGGTSCRQPFPGRPGSSQSCFRRTFQPAARSTVLSRNEENHARPGRNLKPLFCTIDSPPGTVNKLGANLLTGCSQAPAGPWTDGRALGELGVRPGVPASARARVRGFAAAAASDPYRAGIASVSYRYRIRIAPVSPSGRLPAALRPHSVRSAFGWARRRRPTGAAQFSVTSQQRSHPPCRTAVGRRLCVSCRCRC